MKIRRFLAGMLAVGILGTYYPLASSAAAISTVSAAQKSSDLDLAEWIAYAAPYYGLDPDFTPNPSPTTAEELEENIRWCFFTGNYGLNFTYDSEAEARAAYDSINLRSLYRRYPELMGFYVNSDYYLYIYQNEEGRWLLNITVPNAPITPEKLFEQQRKALDAALAFRERLYKRNKLRDGMTQTQIAQVYYTELVKLNVKPSKQNGTSKNHQIYMKYDSAYAALVNKRADCVGRAAAYQLLMDIEGIPSMSVSGQFTNTSVGHVLNLIVADGDEYVCDWGNCYPLQTVEKFSRQFTFDSSLQTARAALES